MIEFVVRSTKAPPLPPNVDAQYFDLRHITAEMLFEWDDFLNKASRKVRVFLAPHILESDENIIATFAHEAYEIGRLHQEFLEKGGHLNAKRLYSLLNEEDGVFHCLAWEHSDSVVADWRGRR